MYISKIILNNFKSFAGKHELKLSDGINFFLLEIIIAVKQQFLEQLNLYNRERVKKNI